MARALSISPSLIGDPLVLGPDVDSASALSARLDLEGPIGLLTIAPGVVLAHALTRPSGRVGLRWVRLPHVPRLAADLPPAEIALVLTSPVGESGRALRLVSHLCACLAEAAVREAAASATTRESLVQVLAQAEEHAGEAALAPADVLALLGSGPDGLAADEAELRLRAGGPNRIERIRRRPLAARFLEQFWSFFAVLLWIGGASAFLAGMPQLGWAIFAVIVVNGVFSFLPMLALEEARKAAARATGSSR